MHEVAGPSDVDILLAQIGCSATAKWLLIRLMRALEGRASHSIRVGDLCDQLKIGQESFFKALNDLDRNKAVFMRLEQSPAAKAGRPARLLSYGVGARLKASVSLKPKSGVVHDALCNVVLQAESDSSRFPMSKTCLLQLAFLLAMADRCGFVEGVATSEICRALGTSRSSVVRNFNLLTRLGFVRRTVPGFKGSCFLGDKASLHVVNLTHPSYEFTGHKNIMFVSFALSSTLVHRDFQSSLPDSNFVESEVAWWLVKFAKIAGGPGGGFCGRYPFTPQNYVRKYQWVFGSSPFFLSLVISAFYEEKAVCSEHILQAILEKYASSLLSRRWAELSGEPPKRVDGQILQEMRIDFYQVYKGWAAGGLRRQIRLERFLFRLAWGLAKLHRFDIEKMAGIESDQDAEVSFENATFRIMPTIVRTTSPMMVGLARERRTNFLNRGRELPQPLTNPVEHEAQRGTLLVNANSPAQDGAVKRRQDPYYARWSNTVIAAFCTREESECRVSDHLGRLEFGPSYHPRQVLSDLPGLLRARFAESQLTIAHACFFGLLSIDSRGLSDARLEQAVLPRLIAVRAPMEK